MNEVTWTCPHCHHENKDLRDLTATPMCGNCESHHEWNDIVHLSDDMDAYLSLLDSLSTEKHGVSACDLLETAGYGNEAEDVLADFFDKSVLPNDALMHIEKFPSKS